MHWINKRNRKNRKQGHSIVRKFLQRGWDSELGRYINTSYSDLLSEGKMTHLLLREQGYHCCYCMRAISFKGHTTIEHILPRKTRATESDIILHYLNFTRFMKRYVMWSPEPPVKRVTRPPYPHFCSYENMVVSCDGSIRDMNNPDESYSSRLHSCCNNFRSNKEIIPMFYLKNIKQILTYERDGELTCDDKYEATIKALNLQHETLKLMRKAWARVCCDYTEEDVKSARKDKELRNFIVDDSGLNSSEGSFLIKDDIWNVFYEYRWFYSYFKNK